MNASFDTLVSDYRASVAAELACLSRLLKARSLLMAALNATDDQVQRLVDAAAVAFGVRSEMILGSRRKFGRLPLARWAVLDALRRDGKLSHHEVADLTGVEHTSVCYAKHALADTYSVDPRARAMIDQFNRLRGAPPVCSPGFSPSP